MTRFRKTSFNKIGKNRKAASPAISMVIITAVTIVLVLVTGNYAYQVLERQKGTSEFDAAKRSILTFDDIIRDVAWDRGGSRSTRFTANCGYLQLMSGLPVTISVSEYSVGYNLSTGYVRYRTSTDYITFGEGYEYYILGNNKTVVSASTESFGQALIKQEPNQVDILLNYRVRAILEGPPTPVNSTLVNYVDILIIRINVTEESAYTGEFDLTARNTGITTKSFGAYEFIGNCTVSVSLGDSNSSVSIGLEPGKVVFNFIIAEIQLSV